MPAIETVQKALTSIKHKLKDLQYGSIEVIVINGEISRIDIKESIKPKDNK